MIEGISTQIDIDGLLRLVACHVYIMNPTFLHIAEVQNAHLLSLGKEECVHELDLDVLSVRTQPDVVDQPRRVVVQDAGSDEREKGDYAFRESVPKPKDYTEKIIRTKSR